MFGNAVIYTQFGQHIKGYKDIVNLIWVCAHSLRSRLVLIFTMFNQCYRNIFLFTWASKVFLQVLRIYAHIVKTFGCLRLLELELEVFHISH